MDANEANAMVDAGLKEAGIPDLTNVPLASPEEVAVAESLGAETAPPVLPEGQSPESQPAQTATVAQTPVKPAEAAQPQTHTDLLGLGEEAQEVKPPSGNQATVPVVVVADLREKIRQLKAENEQLKQLGNAPPAETGDELAAIEQGLASKADDDILTVAETKKILGAVKATTARIAQSAASRVELSERAAFRKAVVTAEAAARQAHADYDSTMNTAKMLGGFTQAEIRTAYQSDNPMESLYETAHKKISLVRQTLGIPAPPASQAPVNPKQQTPSGQQPTPAGAEEKAPTDADIFDSVFSPPKTG